MALALFALLLILLPSRAQAQQSGCSASPNAGALLPQDECYQRHLYDWLETLRVEDLTLDHRALNWDGFYRSTDDLARLWLETSEFIQQEPTFALRGEARWFVLDDGRGAGIEGSGRVVDLKWASDAANWYGLDIPRSGGGQANPYYGDAALCRRALVSTAVDLMMDHREIDRGQLARSDYLGGAMTAWAYAYDVCRAHVSPSVRRAGFEAGFSRMFDYMLLWGPRQVNTNMDTRAISAAAFVYRSTEDAALRAKALRVVRRFLFGSENGTLADVEARDVRRAIFNPAGYVSEGRGPETTYNGVSLYHIAEAYALTLGDPSWSFLKEVVERMVEFKLYQSFVDPLYNSWLDGYFDGPSGYANRTGDSYVYDQRDRTWRDVFLADVHPREKALVRRLKDTSTPLVLPVSEMAERVRESALAWYDRRGVGQPMTSAPPAWRHEHWPIEGAYHPPAGWYGRLQNVLNQDGAPAQTPWERPAAFSRDFGGEFWAYKAHDGRQDFGFFVEHVGRQWPYESWAGGSLQAFWTREAGLVLLSKHNKTGDEYQPGTPTKHEDTRVYEVIDTWGAHHVWGQTTGGGSFSSATWNDNGAAEVERNGSSVTVEGGFQGSDRQGWSLDRASVETQFTALQNGISVARTVRTDGRVQVEALWETLPVFLGDCNPSLSEDRGMQCGLGDTSIEYGTGSAWRAVGTSLVETDRLRLGRDFGSGRRYVYVYFDGPRRVRLSGSVWQGVYQTQNRLRNVHVQLHTGGTLPEELQIEYRITTASGSGPVNAAPTAGFTWAADGLSVQFSDASFDSDGSVAAWSWNFGDGATSTARNPQHTYAAAGTYTVTLQVVDDEGAATSTAQAVAVASSGPAPGVQAAAPRAQVQVDGEVGEWSEIPRYAIAETPPGASTPPASDLSAQFTTAWDAEYLYVLAEVTDDRYEPDGSAETWRNDGIEIEVDGLGDRQPFFGADDHQVLVRADGVIEASGYGGGDAIRTAAQRTADGYRLEVALRWSFIGGNAPRPGRSYGFNVNVNDADGGADLQQLNWVYSPEHWRNTSGWGTLVLGDEGTTVGVAPEGALPEAARLEGNYPNPFNPRTTISYALARAAEVRLEVFDALGRRVALLVEGSQAAGSYAVPFVADHLPSGVYLYRLRAGAFEQTRAMLLAK